MKKTVLVLGLLSGLQFFGHAQKAVTSEIPQHLFIVGKEMFLDKNYVGAQHYLSEFTHKSKDKALLAEAEYMLVATLYYQGKEQASERIKDYLEKYPFTYHRQELAFWAGSCHFQKSEWRQALYWFEQSDINYLNTDQQQDYAFRLAYTYLKEDMSERSYPLFQALVRTPSRYTEDAIYYMAYIDFYNKNYPEAIKGFEQLTHTIKYKETSCFYLLQIDFIQGNSNRVIQQGEALLGDYPNGQYREEIFRILGNTYFRKGIMVNAISNYEKCHNLIYSSNSLHEDLLFLGSAYNSVNHYAKAIPVLKEATASQDNDIRQQAYMQLGVSQEQQGDLAGALLSFQSASKIEANSLLSERALFNYAMLTYGSSVSTFGESVSAFKQFLEKYPTSTYAKQINEGLATVLLSSKNYQASLSTIATIQRPDRQILEAKQMILLQLGIQNSIEGNKQQAIETLNQATAMGLLNKKAYYQAIFWKAEALYAIENYTAAVNNFNTFISQVSSSEENATLARYELGYAYFKLEQYAKANEAFLHYVALEKDKTLPNYADALNRIADGYLFARNYSQADEYYSRAINLHPADADYAEFQRAFVLGLQHKYAQKVAALDRLITKYPRSHYLDDALFEKSRALVMLSREKEAISTLETLLERYSDSSLALKAGIQLGQMYDNNNQSQKAIDTYKNVAKASPGSEEGKIALHSLENLYKETNNIEAYVAFANTIGGGVSISTLKQDSLTFAAAENIFIKGKKQEAQGALQKYLQSYPQGTKAPQARFYLAKIAEEKGDTSTVLSLLRQVIENSTPSLKENALQTVASIEYGKGNYSQAYQDYEKLLKGSLKAETKTEAWVGLMQSAMEMKQWIRVEQWASEILTDTKTAQSTKQQALLYRAKAYMENQQKDKALADLEQCASDTRYVQGAESHYLISLMYLDDKQYDKAITQVEKFMKQGTVHQYWLARAIIVLADAYQAKGDKFSAKQYLQSLQDSYQGAEKDITEMISERLSKL